MQYWSKLPGDQPMRNGIRRTQCRQAGCQQPEGHQNHSCKSLYLHQAQQHRSCSQWFHRKRHKNYCILHGLWCIFDCLELLRIYATIWRENPPATHYREGTSRWFWGGQRNWLNCWSVGEWNRYLKWNTVIIERFFWKDGCLTSHDLWNCKSLDDL